MSFANGAEDFLLKNPAGHGIRVDGRAGSPLRAAALGSLSSVALSSVACFDCTFSLECPQEKTAAVRRLSRLLLVEWALHYVFNCSEYDPHLGQRLVASFTCDVDVCGVRHLIDPCSSGLHVMFRFE